MNAPDDKCKPEDDMVAGATVKHLPYTCECGSNEFERLTIISGALRELLTINPNGTVHVQPLKPLKRPKSIICHHCRKRHFIKTR